MSFALLLHRDETIDFWFGTEPDNWRTLFRWGLFKDWYKERTPMIAVYRPENKIGYNCDFVWCDKVGESPPFPNGVWT